MFDYLPKLETPEEIHKRVESFAIKYSVNVRVITNGVRCLSIPEIPAKGGKSMSEKIQGKEATAALKLIFDYCQQQDGCQACEFFKPYGMDDTCLFRYFAYPLEWKEHFDMSRP